MGYDISVPFRIWKVGLSENGNPENGLLNGESYYSNTLELGVPYHNNKTTKPKKLKQHKQ